MPSDAIEEGQPELVQFPRKLRLSFGILLLADELAVGVAGGDEGAARYAMLSIEFSWLRAGDADVEYEWLRSGDAIVRFQIGCDGGRIDC